MSIKSKIQSLITAANAKTGESDTTLTDAVQTLVDGYGQGGVGWTTDGIADGSEPNGDIEISSATLARYAFASKSNLGKVAITNATTAAEGSFRYSNFDVLSFDKLSTSTYTATYFLGNTSGNAIVFKGSLTNIANWQYWFRNVSVGTIDFSESFESFNSGNFYNTTAISKLILRNKSQVVSVNADTGILNNATKALALTVYVPSDLISQYQAASNWSVGYANNPDLFQPIEDSIYETQYADGTPIPTT